MKIRGVCVEPAHSQIPAIIVMECKYRLTVTITPLHLPKPTYQLMCVLPALPAPHPPCGCPYPPVKTLPEIGTHALHRVHLKIRPTWALGEIQGLKNPIPACPLHQKHPPPHASINNTCYQLCVITVD